MAPNLSHWHVQPNSGLKGNFTPEFVGSSPAVIPFQKLSWTEEFLQHMRALSTAAEFADPDIAATDTVDNIIILASHPGDRLWRIFRPDPQDLRRPLFLDLHVTTQMTLSDIQTRIQHTWPDLIGGAPNWELIEVAHATYLSLQVHDESEVFLIKAEADYHVDGEWVVLVETQQWLITDAWLAPLLHPMIIHRTWHPNDLVSAVGWAEECERVLCPITANGMVRRPYDTLNVGHGAYLVVHCAQEATQIMEVTGDLTTFEGQYMAILPLPVLQELPDEPSHAIMGHMGPLLGYTWQKVRSNVKYFQRALTDAYRYLFWHSGLRYVRRSPIALFYPSAQPGIQVTFFRLAVEFPLNIPVIYSTLIEYELVPEDDWTFIFMSHHIADLWLPQDAQYFGVVGEEDRQFPLALNLALFEIHRALPYGRFENLPEHRAVMGMEETSWFGIIHLLDLLEECMGNLECAIQLEGQYVLPSQADVYLFEGATVRIWIGSHFDPETNSPDTDDDSDDIAMDQC